MLVGTALISLPSVILCLIKSLQSFVSFFTRKTVSRLNNLDAAVHRLNVQFYHMDVKVSQFSKGLAELRGGLAEARESLASLNEIAIHNQKELGKIDGEDKEDGTGSIFLARQLCIGGGGV